MSAILGLDGNACAAYLRGVKADTPVTPDDAPARGLHTTRRRRPAIGAEAARRREFGRVFGQANREAGQRVRDERDA